MARVPGEVFLAHRDVLGRIVEEVCAQLGLDAQQRVALEEQVARRVVATGPATSGTHSSSGETSVRTRLAIQVFQIAVELYPTAAAEHAEPTTAAPQDRPPEQRALERLLGEGVPIAVARQLVGIDSPRQEKPKVAIEKGENPSDAEPGRVVNGDEGE